MNAKREKVKNRQAERAKLKVEQPDDDPLVRLKPHGSRVNNRFNKDRKILTSMFRCGDSLVDSKLDFCWRKYKLGCLARWLRFGGRSHGACRPCRSNYLNKTSEQLWLVQQLLHNACV